MKVDMNRRVTEEFTGTNGKIVSDSKKRLYIEGVLDSINYLLRSQNMGDFQVTGFTNFTFIPEPTYKTADETIPETNNLLDLQSNSILDLQAIREIY